MILLVFIPLIWLIARQLLLRARVDDYKPRRFDDHYTIGNAPMSCPFCGSYQFDHDVKSVDGGVVSEYELNCQQCLAPVGYWAYGSWNPAYSWGKKEHVLWSVLRAAFCIKRRDS